MDPALYQTLGIAFGVLPFIVNILLAHGVERHARNRGGRTVLFGPRIWALSTLFGGILVVLSYWIIHESSLQVPATAGENRAGQRPS